MGTQANHQFTLTFPKEYGKAEYYTALVDLINECYVEARKRYPNSSDEYIALAAKEIYDTRRAA